MAENHYNRSTLDDLVRVQMEAARGGVVKHAEVQAARDAAHAALDAQLDVPQVLTRSQVRDIYWKHANLKAGDAPTLPKGKA